MLAFQKTEKKKKKTHPELYRINPAARWVPSISIAEDFSTSGMPQPPLLLDSPEVIASVFLESVPVCASWPLQLLCLLVSDHLKERKTPQYPGVPDQKPTDVECLCHFRDGARGMFS